MRNLCLLLCFLLLCVAWDVSAQTQTCENRPYCIGKVVDGQVFKAWNIDVQPDGSGLPKGQGTVTKGAELFNTNCSVCHGDDAKKGRSRYPIFAPYPTLIRKKDRLGYQCIKNGPEQVIGSYWPYSTTVFDYIRRAMPFWHPQSLSDDEVYSLAAYLFYRNGLWSQEDSLNDQNLATIKMPNSQCFVCDPRPDTDNKRCLKDCPGPEKAGFGQQPKPNPGNIKDCMPAPAIP